ncbi:cytochrome-c oxidase, cbb3-type subunit III [Pelagibacterium flavum]|uniref:Cbb3-type cytochrome c oxidase subunit n=1 Tax=Pelagibacterium flavum TaxID=2984530 RepID=A0ABY6IQG7_9HYPH|nr:cytochrome-c oxidase, cbb3-type subunit III [Pelagibacterium sp. YIM 151497]UYQ71161.1 cytochrome-c oxidase, cbb3-type subunit III [Pelagibacterium sp. YIM 151497]UYQ72629.1 cytochrome-c oxidase, cbb3-type subunit III [Pelagibacterium sp. YIM 151497]|eukprot:jgi/Tetstr1/450324/TSEL_037360.t1
MSEKERDEVTGEQTTGHEWNGIKELDTPVPRGILIFVIVTHVFAVIWWVLMPAFPLGWTYTPGVLGINQVNSANEAITEIQSSREAWSTAVLELPEDEILADAALMEQVTGAGHQLFGDNCAACHGRDAEGGVGYPDLTDNDWIWGDGSVTAIADTLRIGINAQHVDTRFAQMPAFGAQQMLSRPEVINVARYVYSLSNPDYSTAENLESLQAGRESFATNCAGCHGEDATGFPEAGAPNLADGTWIYGGELTDIIASVHGGRVGHMPSWEERLTPAQIRTLALYVYSLANQVP